VFEFTKSVDGRYRMSVKVKHRLSLDDLANVVIAACASDFATEEGARDDPELGYCLAPDIPVIVGALSSRRAAMKIVRDELRTGGEERASYYVGDNGLPDVKDAVLARLRRLWEGVP